MVRKKKNNYTSTYTRIHFDLSEITLATRPEFTSRQFARRIATRLCRSINRRNVIRRGVSAPLLLSRARSSILPFSRVVCVYPSHGPSRSPFYPPTPSSQRNAIIEYEPHYFVMARGVDWGPILLDKCGEASLYAKQTSIFSRANESPTSP